LIIQPDPRRPGRHGPGCPGDARRAAAGEAGWAADPAMSAVHGREL